MNGSIRSDCSKTHNFRSGSTIPDAHPYGVDAHNRLVEHDGSPVPVVDGILEMVDSTRAIQEAIDGSLNVDFGPGIYFVRRLRFGRSGQTVTFAGGAVLCPISEDSVIEVAAPGCTFRGLAIHQQPFDWGGVSAYSGPDPSGACVRATAFGIPRPSFQGLILDVGAGASNTTFHDLQVQASYATDAAVRVWGVTTVRFYGGLLVGGAWGTNPQHGCGTGIRLGNERLTTADAGAYETLFVGMTIREFRFVGVHFCGTAPFDEPTFIGCNIEQVGSTAILVRPFFPAVEVDSAGVTVVRGKLEVKCLNVIGCHFEGMRRALSIERHSIVRSGSIQGSRFGLYEKGDQASRLRRCSMVSVEGTGSVELTQAWSGPPPEGPGELPSIPRVSTGVADRQEWIISQLGDFAGEGVTNGTLTVPGCTFEEVHVSGNMLVGFDGAQSATRIWNVGAGATLAGTLDIGNRWQYAQVLSNVSRDVGLGFEAPALGARRVLLADALSHLAVPAPEIPTVPPIELVGPADLVLLQDLPRGSSVVALANAVNALRRAFLELHRELRESGVLRKDTGVSSFS